MPGWGGWGGEEDPLRPPSALITHAFMMRACSSIRLPSPMTMGPASAMILALGWTTVLGPAEGQPPCHPTAAHHPPPPPPPPPTPPGHGERGRGVSYRWSRPRGSRSPRTPRPPARSSRCGNGRRVVRGIGARIAEGRGAPGVRGRGGHRDSPLLHLLRHDSAAPARGGLRLRGAGPPSYPSSAPPPSHLSSGARAVPGPRPRGVSALSPPGEEWDRLG